MIKDHGAFLTASDYSYNYPNLVLNATHGLSLMVDRWSIGTKNDNFPIKIDKGAAIKIDCEFIWCAQK